MGQIRKMVLALLTVALTLVGAGAVEAHDLSGPLKPLSFLLGQWRGGGDVADAGGTASGVSVMTNEANGGVILRKDHTQLFDKAGKPIGAFDQIMIIYEDVGGVRAEYSDGQHLIHYDRAKIKDGRSVTFQSAASPGAPMFTLRYETLSSDRLKITFGMIAPGGDRFQPIAVGELFKAQ